jgi:hypothetical protein
MKPLAILALVLSGVFWGLGFPLGKAALREMTAAQLRRRVGRARNPCDRPEPRAGDAGVNTSSRPATGGAR